jgi:hypothetical protein
MAGGGGGRRGRYRPLGAPLPRFGQAETTLELLEDAQGGRTENTGGSAGD